MKERILNLENINSQQKNESQERLSLISSEEKLRQNQTLYPVNEGNKTVYKEIIKDIGQKNQITIVTGYASLHTVIDLCNKAKDAEKITIVFGNEPYIDTKNKKIFKSNSLEKEAVEFWISKGISPSKSAGVLRIISLIDSGVLEARFSRDRNLHAKLMKTDDYVIFGSSNYSENGLKTNREFNKCSVVGQPDFLAVSNFIDGCVMESEDYSDLLRDILDKMIHYVGWEEALAKASSALLEGEWIDTDISGVRPEWEKLWRHQKQAVAQSLSLVEIQGGAIIADPTGSGKTNSMSMAMRVIYNRLLSKNIGTMDSLIPILVCPPSVKSNWHRAFDKVGVRPEVMSQGILSNTKGKASENRVKLISSTPLLGVDEAHNFLSRTSNRTRRLKEHNADATLLATATPINTGFGDLIKELEIMGIGWYDPEKLSKLRRLEKDINAKNKTIRNDARNEARQMIQPFMVRRTRNEIQNMVERNPNDYMFEGRICKYPDYDARSYKIGSKDDDKILTNLMKEVEQISGISRINKIRRTKKEEESGVTEETCLRRTISGSSGLAKSQIWQNLDSSKVALLEHLRGTDFVEEKFGIETKKSDVQKAEGVLNTLSAKNMPIVELSDEFVNSKQFPSWLSDEDEFQKKVDREIEIYTEIERLLEQLSDSREQNKLELVSKKFLNGDKVLAYDRSIITLYYFQKRLSEKLGHENVMIYTGSGAKTKEKKVEEAEKNFGKFSEEKALIGLMSDSMSEGINLQGASVLIHLNWASTIRLNEQRVGRIDRMDTKHERIEVYWPEFDLVLQQHSPDAIVRNNLVRDVIGSNLELPDEFKRLSEEIDEWAPENPEDLAKRMFVERNGLEDAFKPVRDLIGENGIVDLETYEEMKDIDAKVLTKVSLLESSEKWCFACISTRKNGPPIWVYIDGNKLRSERKGIDTDLQNISNLLQKKLPKSENVTPDEDTDEIIAKFMAHLQAYEAQTFSHRKSMMVDSARKILSNWLKSGLLSNSETVKLLMKNIAPSNVSKIDLSGFVNKWSLLTRDYQKKYDDLPRSKRRRTKLQKYMTENPPSEERLQNLFRDLSTIEPVEERVVALIIGVGHKEYIA